MKKILAITVAAVLSLSLTACSRKPDNNNANTIDSVSYKVGTGSYTVTEDSTSSLEGENGRGVVSTTYVTVIFDENNVIRKAYIDEVESKIYFDANGQLVENSAYSDVLSKRELGDSYNMRPASSLGKEWYEQVDSIESWLVGKNISDISSGVMNNGIYGNNDYANSMTDGGAADGIVNGTESMINGAVDGAESMIDGTMSGVESALDGSAANDGTNAGANSSTANGIVDGNSGTMNSNSDATDGSSNSASGSGTSSGGTNEMNNTLNWDEDLKASATIDTTNIQIALHKAYLNAR